MIDFREVSLAACTVFICAALAYCALAHGCTPAQRQQLTSTAVDAVVIRDVLCRADVAVLDNEERAKVCSHSEDFLSALAEVTAARKGQTACTRQTDSDGGHD